MLVLSRKTEQSIVIGTDILLRVLSIRGNSVRLGVEAPLEVPIRRAELSIDPLPGTPLNDRYKEEKRSA